LGFSFEYYVEELGLDSQTTVKIKEIKQLRLFVSGQPWGIFFVELEIRNSMFPDLGLWTFVFGRSCYSAFAVSCLPPTVVPAIAFQQMEIS
jgi:hypothetical protein